MIGEIIVEKRAARVVNGGQEEERGGQSRNWHTKDDEVVHYTAERVCELHYAYSGRRIYTYCMRNALMRGVVRDVRLVVQALKMRRQNTTLCSAAATSSLR